MPAGPTHCGARTRAGTPCERAPMPNGRCHKHGGKTPRGVASTQFVNGRRSKDIPSRLTERYQEALVDDELLALRDDVALIDARLGDVLGRVDSGESGRIWAELGKCVQAYHRPGASDTAQLKRAEALRVPPTTRRGTTSDRWSISAPDWSPTSASAWCSSNRRSPSSRQWPCSRQW
jgi:hypothetical protein